MLAAALQAAPADASASAAGLLDDGEEALEVPWSAPLLGARFARYMARVRALDLVGVWDLRPLLDVRPTPTAPWPLRVLTLLRSLAGVQGKEVAALLGVRQGPQIGQILSRLLEWQLEHPAATADEARAYITATNPQ